ncbi:NAD-dependent epimerase/dehydratase family protein [Leptospira langatensis]|uniref:NAD-dependent epimerase/dehydratase family protein n=1 Tax=Leptospira langatensis TaxID=2484983 RepID=A0A5F1ZVS0_9LEPT|nr:GDP-mannose 4,6-dehydratase [Leptospira langatensis]TGK02986.1 NAD-dependent epimerase/dehydratase family protein [Leptospira langatensis]TGL41741.1 NAD-dependent epimerase/dehydratase family protein [Leptospira langatensis]
MKYLITGADGFVGSYLIQELLQKSGSELLGLGLHPKTKDLSFQYRACDLREPSSIHSILSEYTPDIIFHLAGQTFVPRAIEDPNETLTINVGGTLNLLEWFRKSGKNVKIVYVSSSDVYGNLKPEHLPVSENLRPEPLNPYSSSKVAAETYCLQFARSSKNIEAVIARPFNHIGVGQNPNFVVPNFCKQVLETISKSSGPSEVSVGDLTPTRDFLHVTDVVRAYVLLSESGRDQEIYNICSGTETPISQVLEWIIEFADSKVETKVDPARLRPMDMRRSLGDNSKLRSLGWAPKVPLKEAVREIFEHIRKTEYSS